MTRGHSELKDGFLMMFKNNDNVTSIDADLVIK